MYKDKVMKKSLRRYALFTNIGSSAHEASLLAPRTHVHEAMNIGGIMNYANLINLSLATTQGYRKSFCTNNNQIRI